MWLDKHLRLDGAKLSQEHKDNIIHHILFEQKNKSITIKEIEEGIAYGWYYISYQYLTTQIEVNKYNKHL